MKNANEIVEFKSFSDEDLLIGLSIEELQERREFTAPPDVCWCDPTPPCCFTYGT